MFLFRNWFLEKECHKGNLNGKLCKNKFNDKFSPCQNRPGIKGNEFEEI